MNVPLECIHSDGLTMIAGVAMKDAECLMSQPDSNPYYPILSPPEYTVALKNLKCHFLLPSGHLTVLHRFFVSVSPAVQL